MVKVVAAYLLANLGGVAAPAEADIKKILGASEAAAGRQQPGHRGGMQAEAAATEGDRWRGQHQRWAGSRGRRVRGHEGGLRSCLVALLCAVGAEADSERVQKLLSELEGKDVHEVGLRQWGVGRLGVVLWCFAAGMGAAMVWGRGLWPIAALPAARLPACAAGHRLWPEQAGLRALWRRGVCCPRCRRRRCGRCPC